MDINWMDYLSMLAKTTIIFFYTILLIRIAKTRIRLKTPLDFVIIILLGSLLSRPINGDGPFFPTLVATFFLIVLHLFFSWATYKSRRLGKLFKGYAKLLVKDGDIQWKEMEIQRVTKEDLVEEARKNNILDLNQIKEAHFERDGSISFVV